MAINRRRGFGGIAFLSLVAAFVSPWPFSLIAFVLGLLVVGMLVMTGPNESDLAAHAAQSSDNPDLMSIWDVSDASGVPVKAIPRTLERAEVPRADQRGWRVRLPVPSYNIQYRRVDISRWLGERPQRD
jgi:hypothetical protein